MTIVKYGSEKPMIAGIGKKIHKQLEHEVTAQNIAAIKSKTKVVLRKAANRG
jgi:hypothetical protein